MRQIKREEIIIFDRGLSDVNPVVCGLEECDPRHSYQAVRDYYLLHYIFSGKGSFRVGGQEYPLAKDYMFLIKPGVLTRYEADPDAPWHYAWVGFSTSRDWSAILCDDVFFVPGLRHIFLDIISSREIEGNRELYISGKLFELLCHLDRRGHSADRGPKTYVLQAKNYIKANYMDNISVSRLASMLNLERSYFSTIFKKHTGSSPQQYLIDYRMKKAAELIAVHGYKIEEAALACGYSDSCNFSKMFKSKFGIPPAKYARQCCRPCISEGNKE